MNKRITFIIPLIGIFFFSSLSYAEESNSEQYTRSYTSIDEKDCMTLDSDDLGSIQECEPFEEIGVKVVEGDIRQSITLTYHNREYILNFQSTVSTGFSTLGTQIEWRHEKGKAEKVKGMIVRLDVNDDPEDLDKITSYLVVSKITPKDVCVVGKILFQPKQDELARAMLDSKEELPCLKITNSLKNKDNIKKH